MDCFNEKCEWISRSGKICERSFPSDVRPSSCPSRMSHPPRTPKVQQKPHRNKNRVKINYWFKDWSEVTGYSHNQEFPYSDLHNIIDHVLECGLFVMLLPDKEGVILAIDDGAFHSR